MKTLRKLPYILALVLSALALLCTFLGVAWYSDERGLFLQWGLNVGTKNGLFSTLSDLVFTLAPVFSLIALVFLPQVEKKGSRFCLVLQSVPTALYALMELILFLTVKEGHFSLVITYCLILLVAALAVASAFLPDLWDLAEKAALAYVAMEVVLGILSLAFGTKLSTFVFSQLLPISKLSTLRVTYVVISMLVYFLSYALALFFRLRATPPRPREDEASEAEAQ